MMLYDIIGKFIKNPFIWNNDTECDQTLQNLAIKMFTATAWHFVYIIEFKSFSPTDAFKASTLITTVTEKITVASR